MKRPAPKTLTARSNERLFEEVKPEYWFENGLRKVKPYYFEYQTYAKERWLGRTVLDVFLKEFRDRPARYYQEAIQRNLIMINGEACTLEQRVEQSDLISHRLHRHEPPVSSQPIRIIEQRDGLLVIDKPASIPAHPSGRYRFNTVVEILRHDHDLVHLSLINRLDRLTSGICILGTNSKAAEKLHQQMEDRQFTKEYIARVVGEFPAEKIVCSEPLRVIEHKLGLVTVDREGGKESETVFERISTNGAESVVRCRPLTGRTHQIRVHLRFLGHPIVNDHLYNNKVWPVKGEPDASELKMIARTLLEETKKLEDDALEIAINKEAGILCPECELSRPDPTPEQLCIYLHAYRYSCDAWSFETEMPSWSQLEQHD
ncbi:Pseudouridine synthase [Paramicrosporidium saccamoebae]|uniref:Pseudouridine synthase n=1 Tax=Paramicrosporidium saccamoebae TaxID=1246581 RepID=A0A2H9TJ23_9FUNG|nr:Pseudouridine synthase [Paramicrosporidium saccamoebae]